jgi:hypothetical protein
VSEQLTVLHRPVVNRRPRYVQAVANQAIGATTVTGNLPANSTAGNLLVACLWNPAGLTFTMPAGWVQAVHGTGQGRVLDIWYLAAAAATASVQATLSASGNMALILMEFADVRTAGPLDQVGANSAASGTAANVASAGNLAETDELAIACIGTQTSGITATNPAGTTRVPVGGGTAPNLYAQYASPTGPVGIGATGETVSASSVWSMALSTFKRA